VLDRWGFGLAGARGLAALFAGAPGTGKTMAAAIVARACARDLYCIDLSQVVSKYIGETEKHLEALFAEAEAADVALFFDEADAIFGKRGAIREAHDRFANIEVGFLLQRIERFPGLVILATNLRKNIDAAFLRRLQVIVEFPAPDVASRARIWQQVWPAAAPVDPGVDPVLLAERFDLSGGQIRNIALSAAYAAAHEGATINLRHVLDAVRSEYRKLDKLVREDSFTTSP
jgi:SpoVK/Ycf46/Vps4 family AAA+-type ATPase